MTRSFEVTVGTSATPVVAPDWMNMIGLPATAKTAGFTVTAAMVGVMVTPYKSASPGAATINTGLTPDIGAMLMFGQAGAGALTLTAGGGVTLTGVDQKGTLGLNHVIVGTQTAPNVWDFETYSWNLLAIGNPNSQPLLVAYGKIILTNLDATNPVTIDTSPNVTYNGTGLVLVGGASHTEWYGNGPAELWYAAAQTTPVQLGVKTGAAVSGQ